MTRGPETDLACVGPRGAGARAQLLLALVLMAVAPFFILHRPIQTHAIKLDLAPLPGAEAPAAPPRARHHMLSSIRLPEELLRLPPVRRIVITVGGRILADGEEVDLIGLHRRLNIAAVTPGHWVELRPDPHARYEDFAETLAVAKRARLERLRLDDSAYVRTLDESYDGSRWEGLPGPLRRRR